MDRALETPPGSPRRISLSRAGNGAAQAERIAPEAPASSKALLCFCALLIFTHFGRPFDTFLSGYRIPAVICSIAILVALLTGAAKLLLTPVGIAFLCLIGWMAVAIPFSFWKGGSVKYVLWYIQFFLILMLVVAEASRTSKDIAKLAGILALSCFFHLMVHGHAVYGRYASNGTFGNSNDMALLAGLAIPFWVLATTLVGNAAVRFVLLAGGCGYALVVIGRTASRSAIPALVGMLIVYLIRSGGLQKVAIMGFAVLGLLVGLVALPKNTLERFASIGDAFHLTGNSLANGQRRTEAEDSLKERKELLNDAIDIAIAHPFFGVGPGQFEEYRFNEIRNPDGTAKPYLVSHNTYLEVASESGIPGLCLYLVFLVSIYIAIRRTRRLNKAAPNSDKTISQACLCVEAALVYFAIFAAFLTCDKHPHQFVLAGIAIALTRISNTQIQQGPKGKASAGVADVPPFFVRRRLALRTPAARRR